MIKGKITKKLHNKYQHKVGFSIKIPNYTPMSIFLRVLFNSLVAVLIIHFMILVIEDALPNSIIKDGPNFYDYLQVILYFNLLSEGQIIVDHVLEYFFPIPKKIKLRILIQTIIGIILIVFVFQLMTAFSKEYEDIAKIANYLGVALGLVFVTLISTTLLMLRLTEKWIQSQKQMDLMKQEKLKMDYNSLQDKLNPHFLFNNLSVLKSLIIYDTDKAVTFTEHFTDVYRYVLQSKDRVLVSLIDELEFIDAYLGLHKERLGEGLQVKISVEKDGLNKEIAPLTLQLLVENAIKHNIVSKDQPLSLEIIGKEDYIGVINTLQLKETSYSTQTGLKNVIQRYKMLSEKEIEVIESDTEFMVKIPLI